MQPLNDSWFSVKDPGDIELEQFERDLKQIEGSHVAADDSLEAELASRLSTIVLLLL